MRRACQFLAVLAGCALAASAIPANAAPACASAADQAAFEVLALRQMMTELATKCSYVDEYNNNFIKRFQPALQANYHEVLSYFRRVYGAAGQGRMDAFTTDLVNEISREANLQGAQFCPRAKWIINEMDALRSMDELAPYAAAKDFGPVGMSMCPAAAPRRR